MEKQKLPKMAYCCLVAVAILVGACTNPAAAAYRPSNAEVSATLALFVTGNNPELNSINSQVSSYTGSYPVSIESAKKMVQFYKSAATRPYNQVQKYVNFVSGYYTINGVLTEEETGTAAAPISSLNWSASLQGGAVTSITVNVSQVANGTMTGNVTANGYSYAPSDVLGL